MTERSPEEVKPEQAQPEPMDYTWAYGMPYTVQFPEADGHAEADLEHPAHLPRVGDLVEYIDERGDSRRYRVRDVVHTLQSSAAHRQTVGSESETAESGAELPGGSGQVRAGLPKVYLEAID